MPLADIPLKELLTLAKKGLGDGLSLPPAVAAEVMKTEAFARRAAASEMIGLLPAEVAKTLAAVPDATAAKTDPVTLARTAIKDAGLTGALAARILDQLDGIERGRGSDLAPEPPDVASGETMLFVEQARLAETITAAGLKEATAKTVLGRLTGPDDLGDQTIGTLVADGTLSEAEGQKLGRTISLSRLLGDNGAAAAKLVETAFSVTGKPVEDLRDLIDVPLDELAKGIAAADSKLRRSAREQAENLRGHLAETFPTRGLSAHLRDILPATATADFAALATAIKGRA